MPVLEIEVLARSENPRVCMQPSVVTLAKPILIHCSKCFLVKVNCIAFFKVHYSSSIRCINVLIYYYSFNILYSHFSRCFKINFRNVTLGRNDNSHAPPFHSTTQLLNEGACHEEFQWMQSGGDVSFLFEPSSGILGAYVEFSGS